MYTEGQNYDCDSSIESLCLVKNIKENGNERQLTPLKFQNFLNNSFMFRYFNPFEDLLEVDFIFSKQASFELNQFILEYNGEKKIDKFLEEKDQIHEDSSISEDDLLEPETMKIEIKGIPPKTQFSVSISFREKVGLSQNLAQKECFSPTKKEEISNYRRDKQKYITDAQKSNSKKNGNKSQRLKKELSKNSNPYKSEKLIDVVLMKQKFNGSWDDVSLIERISSKLQKVEEIMKYVSQDIVLTCIICQWVEKNHVGVQYRESVKKAKLWLRKSLKDLKVFKEVKQLKNFL